MSKRGQTLLEVTVTVSITALLLAPVISGMVRRIQTAKFQETVEEMTAIADASVDYYVSHQQCPAGITQLAPTYLVQAAILNPFLSAYQLSCGTTSVSVSSLIPAGLAQQNPAGSLLEVNKSGGQDNIKITKLFPCSATGRLLYDKKYLYGGT